MLSQHLCTLQTFLFKFSFDSNGTYVMNNELLDCRESSFVSVFKFLHMFMQTGLPIKCKQVLLSSFKKLKTFFKIKIIIIKFLEFFIDILFSCFLNTLYIIKSSFRNLCIISLTSLLCICLHIIYKLSLLILLLLKLIKFYSSYCFITRTCMVK